MMTSNTAQLINCTCGAPLGYVVRSNGNFYLARAGLSMLTGKCRCEVCGRVLHWHGDKCTIEDVHKLESRAAIQTPVVTY